MIEPGNIQFYDNFKPTLEAGRYTATLQQSIELGEDPDDQNFTDVRIFEVAAPRWRLGPQDVHAVYPPPHSDADYSQTLPHIVLRRRSTPWERTLGDATIATTGPAGGEVTKSYPRPWLALLLLTAGELGGATPVTRPINALVSDPPEANVLLPKLALTAAELVEIAAATGADSHHPVPVCQTIDVPRRHFAAIAPLPDELPFLSHIREVYTGGKEILGLEEDGWFSVVVSNRLPNNVANFPNRHIAHLVSLQGWQAQLEDRNVPDGDTSLLRLVTLASWEFTSRSANRGDFKSLLEDLGGSLPRNAGGEDAMLKPPAFIADQSKPAEVKVSAALDQGYVPLHYRTHLGESSAGWYRGPLVPKKIARQKRDPYSTATAAMIYDDTTGLFDISYSVAWQLGRLLALSDNQFSQALIGWRHRGRHLHDLFAERQELRRLYQRVVSATTGSTADETITLEEAVTLLEPRQMSHLISQQLVQDVVDFTLSDAKIGSPYWDVFQNELPGLTDALLAELLLLPPAERAGWLIEHLPQLILEPANT